MTCSATAARRSKVTPASTTHSGPPDGRNGTPTPLHRATRALVRLFAQCGRQLACSGAGACRPTATTSHRTTKSARGPARRSGSASDRNPAPGIERTYNWEYSAAVQHQLTSRVSVSAGWYRRIWKNIEVSDRELISLGDYSSFPLPMPSFANDWIWLRPACWIRPRC